MLGGGTCRERMRKRVRSGDVRPVALVDMLHSLHTPVPVRHRPRRSRALPLVVVLVLVLAAAVVAGALAVAAPGGPSWPGAASVGAGAAGTEGATGPAGGEAPSGASVFDDDLPAVTKLDPDLLEAVRRAARDAEGDGVRFVVNSGWRSAALQERLLDDAVAEYGSRDEAARWVSTPQTSLHVRGEAIDIGDWDAAEWLQDHGAGYGLCQVYDNEAWHFELRPEAPEAGCPRLYADPTADPRMQR